MSMISQCVPPKLTGKEGVGRGTKKFDHIIRTWAGKRGESLILLSFGEAIESLPYILDKYRHNSAKM